MMVHAYYPRTQEAKVEDHKFKASLGCIARSCLNRTKKGQSYFEWKLNPDFSL
jgi:hypothetical protein